MSPRPDSGIGWCITRGEIGGGKKSGYFVGKSKSDGFLSKLEGYQVKNPRGDPWFRDIFRACTVPGSIPPITLPAGRDEPDKAMITPPPSISDHQTLADRKKPLQQPAGEGEGISNMTSVTVGDPVACRRRWLLDLFGGVACCFNNTDEIMATMPGREHAPQVACRAK